MDLSTRHELLGDLFSIPETKSGYNDFRLSDDQVAHFEERGYVAGIRVLTDRQVEALRDELAELLDPNHPGHELWHEYHTNESSDPNTILFHALGAWRIGPGFHDILWNPRFTVPASQLLGGPVRFWHDQLFCKPANHGAGVAWHQDYSYWTRTEPLCHLTCWIALDDVSIDNGCVHYVPTSHRWELLPMPELAGDMDGIRKVLTDQQWEQFQSPVPIELKLGEATFHHPLMMHGSFENRTSRPRRATVINVFRDGVRSASNDELLQGVPPIPPGQPMGGQFFPLLFDGVME